MTFNINDIYTNMDCPFIWAIVKTICDSTHRKGPVVSKEQMDFLLFPKWLFFLLNFGAKSFEIGHCLEIWQNY